MLLGGSQAPLSFWKVPGLPGIVGPASKQTIGVKTFWVRKSEIGEDMPTILGVNFGPEFFGEGGLKAWRNKAEKFAGKIRHQNSLRNSQKSPQIRSAEPRDQ